MEFEFDNDNSSQNSSTTRRRRRQESSVSSSSSCSVVRRRVSVKSAWAVQDAGSHQMLRDEVSDLCSSILSAGDNLVLKTSAAIDLAVLLSNRKRRMTLWQGDNLINELHETETKPNTNSNNNNKTVLQSILDILACVGRGGRGERSSGKKRLSLSSTSSQGGGSSPLKRRTKSARRKLKEQASSYSSVMISTTSSSSSNEWKQVLVCILYFLSWDCTLSKTQSAVPPRLAQIIRLAILQHGKALKGSIHFLVVSSIFSSDDGDGDSVLSTSVASSLTSIKLHSQSTSSSMPPPTLDLFSLSKTNKRSIGDPTAAGRRKRRLTKRLLTSIPENQKDEEATTMDFGVPQKIIPKPSTRQNTDRDEENDFGFAPLPPPPRRAASASSSVQSELTTESRRISPKLTNLLSKSFRPPGCDESTEEWLAMMCLQSWNRVLTGKHDDGPSIMEDTRNGDDDEEEDDDDDNNENPILRTNHLLAKSGAVPVLAKAMCQALHQVSEPTDNQNLQHWHDRLVLLASTIDNACLFHESNRRAFCESDPFSFDDDTINHEQGLIAHIVGFLKTRNTFTMNTDKYSSGILLLALRTLTSLTHDNPVAAKQLTIVLCGKNTQRESSVRGLYVLAHLTYQLQQDDYDGTNNNQEQERYDCTIFCLNTLANIMMEGNNVRTLLVQIKLPTTKEQLWISWLCQWLVQKTQSFREALLSQQHERELQRHEDDQLVAAGNGCVVLACLLKEEESSHKIRRLIQNEIPMALIINTLKAFSNYYQLSLGAFSMAVVAPVKKLIQELQDMERQAKE